MSSATRASAPVTRAVVTSRCVSPCATPVGTARLTARLDLGDGQVVGVAAGTCARSNVVTPNLRGRACEEVCGAGVWSDAGRLPTSTAGPGQDLRKRNAHSPTGTDPRCRVYGAFTPSTAARATSGQARQ